MSHPPMDLDDDAPEARVARLTEFECPSCTANNPHDDGFEAGDEVRCNYCGAEFAVLDRGDGKLKFKEL